MVDVSATALSGLLANERRIAVAAENIANLQSRDFNAKELEQTSNLAGGVSTRVVDKVPPTVTTPSADGGTEQRPNVSVEEELVAAQVASYNAQANLKVLQVQNRITKALVDIQA